jgi:predicted transcriptional regulator
MTQSDAAKLLLSSQSWIAKMESGDSSVSLDLLIRSILALAVSGKV